MENVYEKDEGKSQQIANLKKLIADIECEDKRGVFIMMDEEGVEISLLNVSPQMAYKLLEVGFNMAEKFLEAGRGTDVH